MSDARRKGDHGPAFFLALAAGVAIFLAALRYLPNGPGLRVFSIPATSMAPNLNAGDHALADRFAYGLSRWTYDWFTLPLNGRWLARDPERGDIVVFRLPRDTGTVYVKRLVGLPGDRVRMIEGRLWLNGAVVPREAAPDTVTRNALGKTTSLATWRESPPGAEPYLIVEAEGDTGFLDNTEEFVTPAGHYFFLGDNRDNSVDSRQTPEKGGVGFVPAEFLIGKVIKVWKR